MRFSAVYLKPSQTELLHWVTCLLIAQPEHECTYLSPSPCSKTKALWTHDGPLSSLFTTVSNTILPLPPSRTRVTFYWPVQACSALGSQPRGRRAWPPRGFSRCACSQCSHITGLSSKASSSGDCACVCGSPLLALVELSFKSVFIIRIVTMEEFFFLLSILIYLKTTLTWKISEHFSIPSFIKYTLKRQFFKLCSCQN